MKKTIIISLVIIIIAIIAGGVWYYLGQDKNRITEDKFENWDVYKNEEYGIEFKLPYAWDVEMLSHDDLIREHLLYI